MSHPRRQREIRFDLPVSNAKARIANYNSKLAVIICHPWGLLGGSMNNNVGRGWSEVDQVVEASEFLLSGSLKEAANETEVSPPTHILLVGYSYGSLITSSASASIDKCVGFISIAPPFGAKQWLLMFNANHHENQSKKKEDLPRYFILGDDDNFTSVKTFVRTVESYPQQHTNSFVMNGVDHFFFGHERNLLRKIESWFDTTYEGQWE